MRQSTLLGGLAVALTSVQALPSAARSQSDLFPRQGEEQSQNAEENAISKSGRPLVDGQSDDGQGDDDQDDGGQSEGGPVYYDFLNDVDQFCFGREITSTEEAHSHWVRIMASFELNEFDKEHGINNWLREMEKKAYGSIAKSHTDGCSLISGDCHPGKYEDDCPAHVEEVKGRGGDSQDVISWWIFKNIRGLNAFVTQFYLAIDKEEASTSSNIEKIINELGGKGETQDSALKVLTAAFSVVAGSGMPGASRAIVPFSSIAGMLAAAPDDLTKYTGEVKSAFGEVMKNMKENLERTLLAATGASDNDDDYKGLMTRPSDSAIEYESLIAQFLDTGVYLGPLDKNELLSGIKEALSEFQIKIAVDAMRNYDMALWINSEDNVKNKDDCIYDKTPEFRRWLEFGGKMYCVQPYALWTDAGHRWLGPSDSYWKSMQDAGITSDKLERIYKSIMNCAINQSSGADRKVDYSSISQGETPKCFYDLRVIDNKNNAYLSDPNKIDARSNAYHEINPKPGDDYWAGGGLDNDKSEYEKTDGAVIACVGLNCDIEEGEKR